MQMVFYLICQDFENNVHIVCYMKETIIASPFDALTNDLTDRTVILFTQVDSRYR